jgi:hypothetical protein
MRDVTIRDAANERDLQQRAWLETFRMGDGQNLPRMTSRLLDRQKVVAQPRVLMRDPERGGGDVASRERPALNEEHRPLSMARSASADSTRHIRPKTRHIEVAAAAP